MEQRRSRARRWGAAALVVACFSLAGAVGRAAPGAAAVDVCSLVGPAEVELALGVDAMHVGGPEALSAAACAWHSADPSCTMRSFGIEVVSGSQAGSGFEQAKLATPWRLDVAGFGRVAYFSTDPLPPETGAQIERLEVHQGDRWVRLTAAGRLGDGGRDILGTVARSVLANDIFTA